jgi:hypothetical protein
MDNARSLLSQINDPDDEWEDISLDQMQNIPNEAERTFNPRNDMSLD